MATNTIEERRLGPAESVLERFRHLHLRPTLQVSAWCQGIFVSIQTSWTTALAGGSLQVLVDDAEDVTSQLSIDDTSMKAIGTVNVGGVGMHKVTVRGEFLSSLWPVATVRLEATTYAYCPY